MSFCVLRDTWGHKEAPQGKWQTLRIQKSYDPSAVWRRGGTAGNQEEGEGDGSWSWKDQARA